MIDKKRFYNFAMVGYSEASTQITNQPHGFLRWLN